MPAPRRHRWSGLAYVLPSLLILLVTALVPVVMTVGYSFTDYSILEDGEFVGFDNYSRMFSDPVFLSALRVTIVFTLISVPLQTIGALVLAEALAKRFRNRFGQVTRSVLFIPSIASMVVAGTVWRMLLGDTGLINEMLRWVGFEGSNFLGRPTSALIAVSLIAVWANVGYFVVIYYAGILEVPASVYEASALDGAGGFRQFVHITMPSVSASTVVVVVLGTIWSFQTFDLIYVMTGGGPGGATSTLVFAIYRFGFQNFQMGYASAVAVVLLVGVLAISVVQNRLLTRKA
ncbi:binding-protein-dependent transport systems inner membrane component [Beutenbergia cavernae DSM 12333]|uniref:Binding-protein-dependent transport systems inner membrane component n=1 Tax=Beutenbergia cavernae (strain ATCC BAA-8 / DSM 12333 / CCUG 43141 / JCM 11478 / NBRC 16432 / NCIMB 13614 / HKI 0122) TaxID=471853 RepID=C5BZP3_BEUC1|nr:sugar ABC transporter permease [Beutenbergia cavernae]ACQ81223.1 binding-protein-dependent transport systems inner membrane component [Beutenbergia cavernae DSM 12333]